MILHLFINKFKEVSIFSIYNIVIYMFNNIDLIPDNSITWYLMIIY